MRVPNLTFIYDRKGCASRDKKGVVELRIGAGKDRKYISTGVKLYPKEWSEGSVVGRRDFKELNNQLQIIKRRCSEIVTQMMDEGTLDLSAIPKMLKESIVAQQTFLEYAKDRAKERKRKVRAGTWEHYELFFRFMESWNVIVRFTDVTEKNIAKMDNVLEKRGLKECSRWNYHKILQTFIGEAVNDGLLTRNPYTTMNISRGRDDGLKRYLSPAEFHRFESCEINDSCLARVRDLFVFQTYTMMSYADLAAFSYKDCQTIEGQTVYKAKRQKTGQEFTIVLLDPALIILKRYKNKLPVISNVKYNLYLKVAVKYAKIDKKVTTHWARHTGATLLLNEWKLPIHIIQHILGHASIRETERTYAKLMDETIVETMVNYQKEKKG
jgi:integrase